MKQPCPIAKKTCRAALWLVLGVGMLWMPAFGWFYQQIPTEALILPENAQADTVVVLTGAKGRLEKGLDLLRHDSARSLFVSGVGEGVKLHELALVAGLAADDAWLDDVARNGQVVLGRQARSTIGNAKEVVAWMQEKQFHSMLLVTSFYHMPRSMYELRTSLPDAVILPIPVFPEPSESAPDAQEFRLLGHNLATWKLIMLEFHKYMARRVMHVIGMDA